MTHIERGEFVHAVDQMLNLTGHPQQDLIADIGMAVQKVAKHRAGHARHRHVGQSKNSGLARLAVTEGELALLVEAQLQERALVQLVDLDGVVGARGGAEGTAGAGVLEDRDLFFFWVELDGVVGAGVDAALVDAGAAA